MSDTIREAHYVISIKRDLSHVLLDFFSLHGSSDCACSGSGIIERLRDGTSRLSIIVILHPLKPLRSKRSSAPIPNGKD